MDLESVLPIQTITENAVINGNGDITVGYRLLLPEMCIRDSIMGQILPGVVVAFENPKGGVGKSTLTGLFAGYIHSQSNEEGGLSLSLIHI